VLIRVIRGQNYKKMKTIIFLLQKEFRQIRRNKTILPIIFIMPIIQLLILVHATTFEIKSAKLCIVDQDMSNTSQRLVHQLEGSSFFKVTSRTHSFEDAKLELDNGFADMIVYIPADFSTQLIREKKTTIQLIPNAINEIYFMERSESDEENVARLPVLADSSTLTDPNQITAISVTTPKTMNIRRQSP